MIAPKDQNNLILSYVYDGRILHHKIILMKYFKRYSYCLENGGINFPSVETLIKYHASKMALPLPCILKENKECGASVDLAKKSSKSAILSLFSPSHLTVRSKGSRRSIRNKKPMVSRSGSSSSLRIQIKVNPPEV